MTADREAMTLEQVRDVLARRYGGSEACLDVNTCELMGAMINGIDSHIYQLKNIMDNVKQRTAQLDSSIARFSHAAEPVAWMYPSDLKRFETSEATADAYSIQVCRPGEDTVALYAHPSEDVRDAKRYRWLRDKSGRAGSPYIRCDDPPFKPMDYWITAGTADSCIDRAMAKESGNG